MTRMASYMLCGTPELIYSYYFPMNGYLWLDSTKNFATFAFDHTF